MQRMTSQYLTLVTLLLHLWGYYDIALLVNPDLAVVTGFWRENNVNNTFNSANINSYKLYEQVTIYLT